MAHTPEDRSSASAADVTHFGFQDVPTAAKAGMVRDVFAKVAERYDLMNDLMSGGIHRLWKAALIDHLNPRPGLKLLDVAGGTGDIAFRVIDRLGAGVDCHIVVCDASPEMLMVGRHRAIDRGLLSGIDWLGGDAQALPLPDRSVDAYTIVFGLRNVTRPRLALKEARRVLRPGGRFLCLEFSHVIMPGLSRLYDLYSFNVLPAMGKAVAGDREAYQYLVESIRQFPSQEALLTMMAEAGLERGKYFNLSGGIAALHSAWRL